MVLKRPVAWLVGAQAIGLCSIALAQAPVDQPMAEVTTEASSSIGSPSRTILNALDGPDLRRFLAEVLDRNPEIARTEQLAAAAAARAPQVAALPDPVAAVTLFVLPPETRVGPQRLSAGIQQKLPWFGKLPLKKQAALYAAAAAEAQVEAKRLDLLTEARRYAYELAFLAEQQAILGAERSTLVRFEQAAQARYAAGPGLQQESIRIQAQITRAEAQLLAIAERRSKLLSTLNRLRDRPAHEQVGDWTLPNPVPTPTAHDLDPRALIVDGARLRPELAVVEANIAAGRTLIELAEKGFRPDVTLGLSYTAVQGRRDAAGRANPPEGDGDDVLALTGSINLPVWRHKLEAAVEEAHANTRAADAHKRRLLADLEGTVGDLCARLPLLLQHLNLLENVLLKQSDEALRSAEIAYSTGKLNAVDLLDAEVMLFEVRISAARVRADLAIALAELEGAVARPVTHVSPSDVSPSDVSPSDVSPPKGN